MAVKIVNIMADDTKIMAVKGDDLQIPTFFYSFDQTAPMRTAFRLFFFHGRNTEVNRDALLMQTMSKHNC